jgi:hypothetical protein
MLVRFWPGSEPGIRDLMPLWTEPAALTRSAPGTRDIMSVVAYDDPVHINRETWGTFSVGLADRTGWNYVPEVLIEDLYQRSQTVAMLHSVELARALLPVANGATTELIDQHGETVEVITGIPPDNAARPRADRLAARISSLLAERAAAAGSFGSRQAHHASE